MYRPPTDKGQVPEVMQGYCHTMSPVRWKPYKSASQQFKRGIKGRWQEMNEYGGWENCREVPGAVYQKPQADVPVEIELGHTTITVSVEDDYVTISLSEGFTLNSDSIGVELPNKGDESKLRMMMLPF